MAVEAAVAVLAAGTFYATAVVGEVVPAAASAFQSSASTAPATDCLTVATSPCYTPIQLRVAYGIKPLLDRGITGRGQTIVLPEFPAPATGSGSVLVKMLESFGPVIGHSRPRR
jgi:subtilase family serine protease